MKHSRMILATIMSAMFAAGTSYAACTAITSLPKTITTPGAYCLTGNLSASVSGVAISVNSSNVTLDLAGFELRNTKTGFGDGIGYDQSNNVISNVVIKNGRVVGFNSGIVFHSVVNPGVVIATNVTVDGVTVIHGGTGTEVLQEPNQGIHLDADNQVVKNCTVNSSNALGSEGIRPIGNNVSIINNDVFNMSDGYGIHAQGDNGIVIENNRVYTTVLGTGTGIQTNAENTIIMNNRVVNTGIGISFDGPQNGLFAGNMLLNCAIPYNAPLSFDGGNNKPAPM